MSKRLRQASQYCSCHEPSRIWCTNWCSIRSLQTPCGLTPKIRKSMSHLEVGHLTEARGSGRPCEKYHLDVLLSARPFVHHIPGGRCSLKRNFSLLVNEPQYRVSMERTTKLSWCKVKQWSPTEGKCYERQMTNAPRAQQNSLKLTRPSWFSSIRRKNHSDRVLLLLQKAQGSSREKSMLNCWKPSWYCSK